MAAKRATSTSGRQRRSGPAPARSARSAVVLLALGAVLLAGCDDDPGGGEDDPASGGGQTATPTEGGGDAGGGDDGGGDDGEAGGTEDAPAGEAAPPPTAPADIEPERGERSVSEDGSTITVQGDRAAFVTPTGNLACVLNGPSASCQLLDMAYSPNPDHLVDNGVGGCAVDAADTMVLTDAGGVWTCPPETLTSTAAATEGGWWAEAAGAPTTGVEDTDAAVLEYGLTLRVGDTTCLSSEDGVTCRSGDLGRQFFISRNAYRFGAS
ncbi:hypothetical protein [uncultured Serinicoccus sp.]|uniref:hypothetical protein n=1 Tax=uncultured Serinicoccus sp. TaxID=735514 RepID=UPI00261E3070|nr:hypothetical protein [uncultured Serinicoccus sp.]